MARYNEILVGRYNRYLQKLFGMKGNAPAPQLAGDISTVFPLFSGVEHRYLEGWERFHRFANPTGGVAQVSAVRIRNPATSNVICVIEKALVALAGGAQVTFHQQATGLDLTSVLSLANTRMDARGRPQGIMVLSQTTNYTNPGFDHGSIRMVSGTNVDIVLDENQELTLLPGDDFTIQLLQANATLEVSLIWRERFLEDSERT